MIVHLRSAPPGRAAPPTRGQPQRRARRSLPVAARSRVLDAGRLGQAQRPG